MVMFATTKNQICSKCKEMQTHFILQVLTIWIYDPENADPNELLRNANEPSLVGGNIIIIHKSNMLHFLFKGCK